MADQPYLDVTQLENHWWWRPGWKVGTRFYTWHITVADLAPLADHVAAYQAALEPFGFLDLVPRPWLHITVTGVGHVHQVSDDQRDAVVGSVRRRLGQLPPLEATFTRPVLHREAVVVPPLDPAPFIAVQQAIRAGLVEACGSAEGSGEGFRPHVSAAYVNAPAAAEPVRRALDEVPADPVTVTITHASLIVLHRDHRMYEWTTVATAPIGADHSRSAQT